LLSVDHSPGKALWLKQPGPQLGLHGLNLGLHMLQYQHDAITCSLASDHVSMMTLVAAALFCLHLYCM